MTERREEIAAVMRSLRRMLAGVAIGAVLLVAATVTTTVNAERGGCERNIADRVEDIRIWEKQAWAADKIAADPFQSPTTRAARRQEAAALWAAIARVRKRVDPEHGGDLVCSDAYPYALPLP